MQAHSKPTVLIQCQQGICQQALNYIPVDISPFYLGNCCYFLPGILAAGSAMVYLHGLCSIIKHNISVVDFVYRLPL